jgi:hypothetical protein
MANEEINVDREWSIDINMSGLTAPTGKKAELPEGHYKCLVTDAYVNPERNRGRVIFKLQVSEGPFTGTIRTDGLNIPKSADDKVRYYWRGLAESAGYEPAQLDAGQVTLGTGSFKGRTVHIHFTPRGEGGTGTEYENIDYLPPAEWNQQRQMADAAGRNDGAVSGEAGSALGGGQLGGTGTGTTVSKNDVMGKLGLA